MFMRHISIRLLDMKGGTMKRKLTVACIALVLFSSLFANYVSFRSRNNNSFNGGGRSLFFNFGGTSSVSFEGCVFWDDPKMQPETLMQYWSVYIESDKANSTCTILDIWSHETKVVISKPEKCRLTSLDMATKTATVQYKDSVINVVQDRMLWTLQGPTKTGHGELIPCWDSRINWYLF